MKNAHEKLIDFDLVNGPTDKKFGLTMSSMMFVFFLIAQYKVVFASLACSFLILAIFSPSVLRPLNLAWAKLGSVLHKITTPVIMLIIYALVFVPFGIVLRLCSKNHMLKYKQADISSYWVDKEPAAMADPLKYQF